LDAAIRPSRRGVIVKTKKRSVFAFLYKSALEEAPKTTKKVQKTFQSPLYRVGVAFRNDAKNASKDDDFWLLLLLLLLVVVVVVVVHQHKASLIVSNWKNNSRDLCAPRDDLTISSLARKKRILLLLTKEEAPPLQAQKTTTHLGVLPGDLFVELGLRAVPERGADRTTRLHFCILIN
jgi:hypothetical protein